MTALDRMDEIGKERLRVFEVMDRGNGGMVRMRVIDAEELFVGLQGQFFRTHVVQGIDDKSSPQIFGRAVFYFIMRSDMAMTDCLGAQ